MKYLKENNKSNKLRGQNNGMWKDRPSLSATHRWIEPRKPKPEFCEDCNVNPPKDLANISQKYLRDVNDFEWLCRKCHMTKDGRLNKFIQIHKDKALPVLDKKCLCCNKEFKTNRETQTTCSLSCSVRNRHSKVNDRDLIPNELCCVSCKNIFKPKRANQLCCSKKCATNYTNFKRWG